MKKITIKEIAPFFILVAVAVAAMFVAPEADFVPAADATQYSSATLHGYWFLPLSYS